MCGIAGLVDWERGVGQEDRAVIARMTRALVHRGPDDEGFHFDPHAALGFRRLSIIDVAGGHQPLSNEDGSVWIVFNGEIYNYRELRDWLRQRGHTFRTQSDTETIVHLYEEVGTGCAERLRGMFAFAIWDSRRRELFLARDRVGKKPLYYASDGSRFWFASEMKSILQDPSVGHGVDARAIDAYLTYGYVPAPMTGFASIRKLPAGHWLHVTEDGLREQEYWDWRFMESSHVVLSEHDYISRLRELLADAVRVRLMSEVPLGAFLSGGIDSSAVVALMAEMAHEPVRTTSIGFTHERYDEASYAREIAERYKTDHAAFTVTADACDVLEQLVWHLDEPFGDSSALPTYYLSKMTRSRVTVALSGDGGDEVFAGYDFHYVPTMREMQLRAVLPGWVRGALCGGLAAVYPQGRYLPRLLRLKTILRNLSISPERAHAADISFISRELRERLYIPGFKAELGEWSSEDLVLEHFRKSTATDWLDRALYVDAKFYLQNDVLTKVDRMSMANSLEVRCPLLDTDLMEFMAAVPPSLKLKDGRCKHLLKEAVREQLPPRLLDRPKQGFSIPVNEWLRTGMRDYAADRLLPSKAFIHDYVSREAVQRVWTEHQKGIDFGTELWMLLMLELWGRRYVLQTHTPPPHSQGTVTNDACVEKGDPQGIVALRVRSS